MFHDHSRSQAISILTQARSEVFYDIRQRIKQQQPIPPKLDKAARCLAHAIARVNESWLPEVKRQPSPAARAARSQLAS